MKAALTILAGLLAGILVAVGILAALVFAGPDPVGLRPTPSPSASVAPSASMAPSASVAASGAASPSAVISSPVASPADPASPSASDGTSALRLGLPDPQERLPVVAIRP